MQASSPDRALIRLSCPAETPDLCRALMQALSETATGGPVVAEVARNEEAPTRPGDLGIALHLDVRTDTALGAHLQWQTADTAPQDGPLVRLDVMDATLSAVRFDRFARDLLRASPGMMAVLRPED